MTWINGSDVRGMRCSRLGDGSVRGCGRTPDIHIYTTSKLPWVQLPPDAGTVPEFYSSDDYWSQESLARRAVLRAARAAAKPR